MKTIEVLYPEFSNIYAELYNVEYLSKCSKNIKIKYTNYGETPHFVTEKVDMIYMGCVSDYKINIIVEELKKYKDELVDYINKDKIVLLTGNAMEIFGQYVEEENNRYECLAIFDYYVEKNMNKKHSSWFIGEFNKIKIIGHKNTFSKCHNITEPFIKVKGGYSTELLFNTGNEGFKYKNLYATYLLGPLLIMNPIFTKYLLNLLSVDDKIVFDKEMIAAYEERLKFLSMENCRYDMSDHG